MKAAVLACVVTVLLVCAGCRVEAPPQDPTDTPDVALDAEAERLEGTVVALPGLAEVHVRLRVGATHGRQVVIDASADGSTPGLDIVDELTRAGWHTLAFVPTEVRVTVVGPDGEALTPRELGFDRAGADSATMFDRYGPPAADESWRP